MALSQKHSGKMLVPWFNSNEWHYVKALLSNTAEENHQQALAVMRIWKSRTPKLPSGVEGTLIILEALLQDQSLSEQNLQILCGSAVMRFLNLCGAGGDKQGTFYKIAKQNNIPDWLINLRHDVAHDQVVPSQYMLNLALQFCFTWVKKEYWEKQNLTIKDFVAVPEVKMDIEPAVQLFCHLNLMYFLNKDHIATMEDVARMDPSLAERIYHFKTGIVHYDTDVKKALKLLLGSVCNHLTGRKENASSVANILVTSGSIFAMELVTKDDGQAIARDFALIWQDLINFLYMENMLYPLVKRLLSFSNDEETPQRFRNYASLWLAEILKSLLLAKSIRDRYTKIPEHDILHKKRAEECLRNDIVKKNPELQGPLYFDFANCSEVINNIKALHLEAVKNCHEFTPHFLTYLLRLCDCSPSYIADTKKLVQSYLIPEGNVESDYEMHTAEEVEQVISKARAPAVNGQFTAELPVIVKKKTKWRCVEDKSMFEGCPLGVLPFQNRDINPLLESLLTE